MKTEWSPRAASGNIIAILLGLAALICIPKLAADASVQEPAAATQSQSHATLPLAAPAGVKTAGQAFKNVLVLKDIPADQLLPAMRYITVALGVRCNYCHNMERPADDAKPQKRRARHMMKMMFAIDNDNFDGERKVTCYTCHRGASQGASLPVLSDVTPPAAANAPAPEAAAGSKKAATGPAAAESAASAAPAPDQILEKYVQALGGPAAIGKISTRVDQGTLEMPAHNMHSSIEIYRQAPGKSLIILHGPRGDSQQGYDGTIAWEAERGEVEELTGDALARAKEAAAMNVAVNWKQTYARLEAGEIEKVGSRQAYCLTGYRASGLSDSLCFDAQSGLLLRISTLLESPLGSLPQETDFDDYRDVNGVKVPFSVRVLRADGAMIYNWEQIQANVPVEDSRFEKPVEKPAAEKPK